MSARPRSRSGSRFPSWLRALLIALVTWLIGSALFVPWLNPLWLGMGRDGETVRLVQEASIDILFARQEAESAFRGDGEWPTQVRLPGMPQEPAQNLSVEVVRPFVLRYTLGDRFPVHSGLRGTRLEDHYEAATGHWQCRAGYPAPPSRYLPRGCRSGHDWTLIDFLAAMLVLCIVALVAMGLLWMRARPDVAVLHRQPRRLRRFPIGGLLRLDRQLGWLRQRDALLRAAGVAAADWRDALAYAAADPEARARRLADSLSAACAPESDWPLPGSIYGCRLPATSPVVLEQILLYLPPPDADARDLIPLLRGLSIGQDVMLVISPDPALDTAITAFAQDPANLFVCLDQATQTEWLLHAEPQELLLRLLSRQLPVTRISPYQTHGGITRPSAFFGRASLLARVLNREPGNYLLAGGRQLGKTSLMKAIERCFADHPRAYCHYLSLRDHRLTARLAAGLSLPDSTAIDALIAAMAARAGHRRLLLLIDEADLFLREEARTGYAQLAALRSLSEEGRCHFMLAGFWDLYEATTLDYASPIRNFGEVIHLGGLEHEACIALATQPLARLGIQFADPAQVEDLVIACGHRANLVAIVCQQALERLERGQRVLTSAHVQAAMGSDAVLDALAGWARLSPDPQACRLDRIIVYQMLMHRQRAGDGAGFPGAPIASAPFMLTHLLDAFSARTIAIDAEPIRRAFSRLQLAYVLKRQGEGYDFAVPLFAAQFRASEVDALLQRELEALRGITELP